MSGIKVPKGRLVVLIQQRKETKNLRDRGKNDKDVAKRGSVVVSGVSGFGCGDTVYFQHGYVLAHDDRDLVAVYENDLLCGVEKE